jgi:hypothetical protein
MVSLLCFSGSVVQAQHIESYPYAELSNDEVSMMLYLPDAEEGFYRATRFDWSGMIGRVQYKGHEYVGAWKDSHDPERAADAIGPAESSKGGGLGFDEALPGGKFIRLGVGIIQKGDASEYDPLHETYKILDHGQWTVDQGADWITFTQAIQSDFGYGYIYEKTVRLHGKGFQIEHRLQNTGEKKIELDQVNHNFFVIDNHVTGPAFHIKYPFKVKTNSDTRGLIKVGGLDIEFLKAFEAGDRVSVELEGFKPLPLFNKFSIENKMAGAGVMVSIDQPVTRAQFWANSKTLCPQHFIQLSIEPDQEQIWTSNYVLFESKRAQPIDYTYSKVEIEPEVLSIIEDKWGDKFIHVEYPRQFLDNVIILHPGDDIQSAIDEVHAAGGGVVSLTAGTYILTETLTPKSKVTLIGAGKAQTVLLQGPEMDSSCFYAKAEPQLTDFVIKDMTLRGTRTGKANGILMTGRNESRHTRILMQNITVADWAQQGVHIKRANHIIMDHCDIQYNGSAGGLHHNVYFLYNKYLLQSDCDMSYPVKGKGNKYTSFEYVIAQRCTIRDCTGNGIQADHEQAGYFFFHKYKISGCGNAALWFPCENYYDKFNYTEDPKYAPQNVILNRCEILDNTYGAMWRKVGGAYVINSTFDNRNADMLLFNCGVTLENSAFKKGNETITDIDDWPQAGKILW